MFEVYRVIWRATGGAQIVIIILSLLVAGLSVVPLEYQKEIVNSLTDGTDANTLFILGAQMFAFILLSLFLKFLLSYRSNLVGEKAVWLTRNHILDTQLQALRHKGEPPVRAGPLATMVSAEAEDLGQFAGGAMSQPVLQIGTLVSVVSFIAASQPVLGLLAAGVILPQAFIVLWNQRRVNRLVAERIAILRRSSAEITTADIESAAEGVKRDFDGIFTVRKRIYFAKLSIKFVLGAINGAGTVGLLMLGGWLVLQGETDIGTVVAATLGLSRLQAPWTALIAFYRRASPMRVRLDMLREALGVQRYPPAQ